jgi:hypothetical protein
MFPEESTESYPHHIGTLREYASFGIQQIMAFAEDMESVIGTLSDDLKPIAEALTKISIEAFTAAYAEGLMCLSNLGLQEFTQATISANHQTKSDILKRSNSDAI